LKVVVCPSNKPRCPDDIVIEQGNLQGGGFSNWCCHTINLTAIDMLLDAAGDPRGVALAVSTLLYCCHTLLVCFSVLCLVACCPAISIVLLLTLGGSAHQDWHLVEGHLPVSQHSWQPSLFLMSLEACWWSLQAYGRLKADFLR